MPDPSLVVSNPSLSDLNTCSKCGARTHTVSKTCMACLDRQYLVEQRAHAAEVLAKNPRVSIEVARDPAGHRHLISFTSWRLAWCGRKIAEPRSKRSRTPAGMFPAALCAQCLEAYEKAVEEAGRARSQAAE